MWAVVPRDEWDPRSWNYDEKPATGVARGVAHHLGEVAARLLPSDWATRGSGGVLVVSELPLHGREIAAWCAARCDRRVLLASAHRAGASPTPMRWRLVDTRGEHEDDGDARECDESGLGRARVHGGAFPVRFRCRDRTDAVLALSALARAGAFAGRARDRLAAPGRQGLGRTANRLLAREFAEADIPFDELRVCHLLGDREDERTLLLRMRGTSKEDGGVGE